LRRLRHDVTRRLGGEPGVQDHVPAIVVSDAAPARATALRPAPAMVADAARFYGRRALAVLALASLVVVLFVRRGRWTAAASLAALAIATAARAAPPDADNLGRCPADMPAGELV